MSTSQLLIDEANLTQEETEFAQIIKSSADYLLSNINDILDFGSIKSHTLQLEMIPFDISTLVTECIDRLSDQIQQKGVDIEISVEESAYHVFTDRGRLGQILNHILKNALTFTNQGKITIRAESQNFGPANSLLHFSVQDTGVG